MFGNDAGGNRETETGAPFLGGKMRQEQFVFVLRGNTVPGISDSDFYSIGFRTEMGGYGNLAELGVFEGFRGIVN